MGITSVQKSCKYSDRLCLNELLMKEKSRYNTECRICFIIEKDCCRMRWEVHAELSQNLAASTAIFLLSYLFKDQVPAFNYEGLTVAFCKNAQGSWWNSSSLLACPPPVGSLTFTTGKGHIAVLYVCGRGSCCPSFVTHGTSEQQPFSQSDSW